MATQAKSAQADIDKSPVGRPTTFTQEIADEIITRIIEGETMSAVCKDPRMPTAKCVWEWRNRYPDFGKALAGAREERTQGWLDASTDLIKSAQSKVSAAQAPGEASAMVAAIKMESDHYKWLASKEIALYRDKTAVEHSGKIQTEEVGLSIEERLAKSPAAREALRKKLAEADENSKTE